MQVLERKKKKGGGVRSLVQQFDLGLSRRLTFDRSPRQHTSSRLIFAFMLIPSVITDGIMSRRHCSARTKDGGVVLHLWVELHKG